jgi:hypothetical protein
VRSGNRLVRTTAKVLIALFAFSCVARSHASQHQHHKHRVNFTAPTAPVYQLDGDLIADRVTLESNGVEKKISIRFGNLRRQEVGFTTETPDVGALVAGDIDRDGDIDIVWVANGTQQSAVVLINQGEGNFVEAENAPFLTELDGLFNSGVPPDKRLTQHRRKQASLPSSSFSDVAPQSEIAFKTPTTTSSHILDSPRTTDQPGFLTRLRGRAPPSLLN